jgi:phosphopantothenoylcysteine decarboxylase/phosphopantothenate--cysteine ligase
MIVIAPTTADFLARIAQGRSDDLLSATVLTAFSERCPVVIIPAMHHQMWRNPATQENVATLRARGFIIMEPSDGPLNNGDVGVGRFPEIFEIFDFLAEQNILKSDLLGKSVVITAGGTREMIDPVRFIGNISSGKQGIALAKAAAVRGAQVTLIAANIAPALLPEDKSISIINISSTAELAGALDNVQTFDLFFMAAAVADYRVLEPSEVKLKRDGRQRSLQLIENPDLIADFAGKHKREIELAKRKGRFIIAFAAESEIEIEQARDKLARKGVDFLFINDVVGQEVFNASSNGGLLLSHSGEEHLFSYQSKDTLSHALLDEVSKALG